MQSKTFITEARQLINDLDNFKVRLSFMGYEEENQTRRSLQRRVNQLFAQLQNPTLPSAYKLRDAAYDAGLEVDRVVRHRLSAMEFVH